MVIQMEVLKIERINPNNKRYLMKGSTGVHTTILRPEEALCTCMAMIFKPENDVRFCNHIKAAIEIEDLIKQIETRE